MSVKTSGTFFESDIDTIHAISQKMYSLPIKTLSSKKLVVVGAGGTASGILSVLARYPFKQITVIDDDSIELDNLERQFMFSVSDLGMKKSAAACSKLKFLCPLHSVIERLTSSNATRLLAENDLVIDCTDNLETRIIIHNTCAKLGIMWLHTAAVQKKGSVALISPGNEKAMLLFTDKKGRKARELGIIASTLLMVGGLATNVVLDYFLDSNHKHTDVLYRINLSDFSLKSVRL